jgi:hypothetical protein
MLYFGTMVTNQHSCCTLDSRHNMHHKHTRTRANDGFAWPFHVASGMVHNFTHNLSIFYDLDLTITKCQKVKPFHAENDTTNYLIQCGKCCLLQTNIMSKFKHLNIAHIHRWSHTIKYIAIM